jgi:hypothetical protein
MTAKSRDNAPAALQTPAHESIALAARLRSPHALERFIDALQIARTTPRARNTA